MENQPRFLQLPRDVRFEIYREARLISPYVLDLSRFIPMGQWSAREQRLFPRNYEFDHHRFPNQLFYVSRMVSEDARRVFYSQNRFRFQHDWGSGLRILLTMGPLAWASLRHIRILLDHRSCRDGGGRCYCRRKDPAEKDSHFRNSGVLFDWRQICRVLGTHIKDDQLSIFVACGAASKETAAAVLDAVNELPRLKHLSIRLGPHRNTELINMILDTIKRKTKFFNTSGPPRAEGAFPLLNLPLELQIRVLECTGLTASQPLTLQSPHHRFVPKDCFWSSCSASPPYGEGGLGVWCPASHTAFSTAHPCWQLCDMRSIGNRRLREVAIQIYYSTNKFEIFYALPDTWHEQQPEVWLNLPTDGDWQPGPEYDPPEYGLPEDTPWTPRTSGFLCGFPEYSWPYLRHIHWMFPNLHYQTFRVDYKGIKTDWHNTARFIRQVTAPGTLTLEIDLCPNGIEGDNPETPDKIALTWALYDQIVEALTCLRGHLKDLFIHNYFSRYENGQRVRVKQERVWERRIMGDDYDSRTRGKQYSHPVIPDPYWLS